MKKKILLFVAIAALAFVFVGCGSSLDSIKKAYDDAGYSTSSISKEDGVGSGFDATKGSINVAVVDCDSEDVAKLSETGGKLMGSASRKGKVVCLVIGGSAADQSAAIAIFEGCF